MARISYCDVCGRSVANADRCADCHTAYLEDLLLQIQHHVSGNPQAPLPEELVEKLGRDKFTSLENFKIARERRMEVSALKQLHDSRLAGHLQKAREQFERENPDPAPAKYA